MSTCDPTTAFTELVRALGTGEQFDAFLRSSPWPIAVLDAGGRVLRWNPAAAALYGWSEMEMRGQLLDRVAGAREGWPGPVSHERMIVETCDGSPLEVTLWRSPIFKDGGELAGCVVMMQDRTEQQFLERGLLECGERERRRIGQELHDHLCQFLLGAAFSAKVLSQSLPPDSSAAADAGQLATLVNSAVQQMRDIARGLRLAELDASGLTDALRELCGRPRPGMQCRFECARPVVLRSTAAARHAYLFVEEAVTNAVQHSRGSEVVVRLSEDGDGICLAISDNGRGFDYAALRRKGFGLAAMEYRARALCGELRIDTPAEGGTAVILLLPKS